MSTFFTSEDSGTASQEIQVTAYNGMVIAYECRKEGFFLKSGQFRVNDNSTDHKEKRSNIDYGTDTVVEVKEFLVPTLTPEEKYRVALSWGPSPDDLDLKVIEFNGDVTCKLDWENKNCDGSSFGLENGAGGDAGVETITWNEKLTSYSYLIYAEDYEHNERFYQTANSQVNKAQCVQQQKM